MLILNSTPSPRGLTPINSQQIFRINLRLSQNNYYFRLIVFCSRIKEY
uniref:Uncharacterized protein n=1 Tax=Lepeophtheirus salmonis TaxID=72036 RepID=A0A0K2UU40_LEPSM